MLLHHSTFCKKWSLPCQIPWLAPKPALALQQRRSASDRTQTTNFRRMALKLLAAGNKVLGMLLEAMRPRSAVGGKPALAETPTSHRKDTMTRSSPCLAQTQERARAEAEGSAAPVAEISWGRAITPPTYHHRRRPRRQRRRPPCLKWEHGIGTRAAAAEGEKEGGACLMITRRMRMIIRRARAPKCISWSTQVGVLSRARCLCTEQVSNKERMCISGLFSTKRVCGLRGSRYWWATGK